MQTNSNVNRKLHVMKRPTINDVAEKAGVSKATVSAVINDRDTVKSATRDHVLAIIKELNFQPKGQARGLKGRTSDRSIGLLVRELDNPFYTSVAAGVKKYANEKDYSLFIASSERDHQNEETLTRQFASKEVKGAIIAPVIDGNTEIDHLFRLKNLNYPFVMLEEVSGIRTNVVSIDNLKAVTDAVKYLIECGHSRIVHFSGPEFASHSHERINGFRNAFSESRLVYNDGLVVPCGSHFDDGYRTGLEYFNGTSPDRFPMAVVCYNDMVAMGLMSALKNLSIRIPEQVSVIGIDDIEFARHWSPALTTISTPLEALGEKAAEILIRNIEAKTAFPVETHVLEAELVIRETVLDLNVSTGGTS